MQPIIIVTGGAGFIGSGVIRELNDRNITNIIVVDDLDTTDKWKNLVGKHFKKIIPIHDCFNFLERKEYSIDGIIHLGACSSTVETDGNFLLDNNTRFSIRLAEYALKNNIRMVYASSAATYGDGTLGFSDEHDRLESLKPLNMYGFSKHLFDLWALRENVLDRLVGLKYFNVFGPNEYHKGRMASMICNLVPQIKSQGIIRLFQSDEPSKFADGEQCRDFIYVKDACRMTCDFLQNNQGGIFNIGRGIPGTWNEVAASIFKALGLPLKIEYIPMPGDLKGKYQNYTCATTDKLQNALGKSAECRPLGETVVEYVQNYLVTESRW